MDKLSALESRERFSPGLCESGEDSLTIDDRFEILGDIGGGAYGTVYKARDKSNNGSIVALKKVTVQEDPEIGIPPLVMRELTNLKRLSSPPDNRDPHIVRYVCHNLVVLIYKLLAKYLYVVIIISTRIQYSSIEDQNVLCSNSLENMFLRRYLPPAGRLGL